MLVSGLGRSNDEEDRALLDDEYQIVCEYLNDFQVEEDQFKSQPLAKKPCCETELNTQKDKEEDYFSDCIEFTDYESDQPDGYNTEPNKFAQRSAPNKKSKL